MDEQWAIERLDAFIDLTKLRQLPPNSLFSNPVFAPTGPQEQIIAEAQIVEQILDRVLPTWREVVPKLNRWQQHRQAAQRAVAELQNRAELAARLGDNAPAMRASGLHPWVWDAARSLWQSSHYREAVRAASVKVNAETQNKLGRRDISETALFQAALSSDAPTATAARLRLAGDDGGKTALSLRRGVAAYAEGCYAAIRNPVSHDEGDLSEQVALEQLAAFSLLARWVEGASVLGS